MKQFDSGYIMALWDLFKELKNDLTLENQSIN